MAKVLIKNAILSYPVLFYPKKSDYSDKEKFSATFQFRRFWALFWKLSRLLLAL